MDDGDVPSRTRLFLVSLAVFLHQCKEQKGLQLTKYKRFRREIYKYTCLFVDIVLSNEIDFCHAKVFFAELEDPKSLEY